MPKYTFRVNGRAVSADSWDPAQPLLYVLRNSLGLHAVKFGCGLGQCGACTVIIDGRAARSCSTPVSQVAGQILTALEAMSPFVDLVPENARRPIDLTGLGAAFGQA